MQDRRFFYTILIIVSVSFASAFVLFPLATRPTCSQRPVHFMTKENNSLTESSLKTTRKEFLTSIVSSATLASTLVVGQSPVAAVEQDEGFESIAARAASMAIKVEAEEEKKKELQAKIDADPRTVYDFSLPIAGNEVPFANLIKQEFYNVEGGDSTEVKKDVKVKAILVVNIKQDDPIARKNIPELISLATKFGRTGEFAVICSPTDQGYFEPDTSALIRLKLASEYGYGINPATIITDKLNLLGTGAHPFWRWIEGTCRTPSGLGRIQGNFEKFLVDGRTGKPVRRYPRKYEPLDIAEDIDAVMKGKPLPPAGANWREEWRNADKEAEKDTYRFQKGLNVFDQ